MRSNSYILMTEVQKSSCKILVAFLVCLSVFFPAVTVNAGSAMEQVQANIDKLLTVLDDELYRKSHSREELKNKLKEIAHDNFDWVEIARRTLGMYWKQRSEDEKKEFTSLITNLLEDTYVNKIVDNYAGEKVMYDKEIIDGTRALISTRIINKAVKEIAVDYRLIKKGENWIGYDVIIEGVSLIKNYRVQFYTIIRKSSYEELVKKIKEKLVD